jgi:hypothetical protein
MYDGAVPDAEDIDETDLHEELVYLDFVDDHEGEAA